METSQGAWDMIQLYSSFALEGLQAKERVACKGVYIHVGKNLPRNADACELMPRTSRFLQKHLPTADVPYIHYNTEDGECTMCAKLSEPLHFAPTCTCSMVNPAFAGGGVVSSYSR